MRDGKHGFYLVGTALVLLLGIAALAPGCGPSDSGSSVTPACDGSQGSGSVAVQVPDPCAHLVTNPLTCPEDRVMCNVTVINGNQLPVAVSISAGSVNVPDLPVFAVPSGQQDVVAVVYSCPASPADEAGMLDIDVSLVDSVGAPFCSTTVDWTITVQPPP